MEPRSLQFYRRVSSYSGVTRHLGGISQQQAFNVGRWNMVEFTSVNPERLPEIRFNDEAEEMGSYCPNHFACALAYFIVAIIFYSIFLNHIITLMYAGHSYPVLNRLIHHRNTTSLSSYSAGAGVLFAV